MALALSYLPVLLLALALLLGRDRLLARLVTQPQRRPDPLGDHLRARAALVAGGAVVEDLVFHARAGDVPAAARLEPRDPPAPGRLTARRGEVALACWRVVVPPEARAPASKACPEVAPPTGTLLLLHGFSDGSRRLAAAAGVAARAGWTSLLVDLPGHGLSSGRTASFGRAEIPLLRSLLAACARDPARFPAPRLVLGYSYGAALALVAALEADPPTRPAALILTAPFWDLRRTMHRHAAHYMGLHGSGLIDRAIALGERRLGLSVDAAGPRAALAGGRPAPFRPAPPLLLLRGADDALLAAEEADALVAAWPGRARLATLEGLGHDGVWQDPRVLARLPCWLAEAGGGSVEREAAELDGDHQAGGAG